MLLKEELLAADYRPQPVLKVEIPKPGGRGMRMLGIPTVVDRLTQQALHQVLSPIFEPHFSEASYGFRPQRNAHQAVYGTVCTVVWEDGGGNSASHPIC